MSDVTAYILILGLIVLPASALILLAESLVLNVFSIQSLLITVPFP